MTKLGIVIPTYGQFDYVDAQLESLAKTTPSFMALVIDDASPDWSPLLKPRWEAIVGPGRLSVHRFIKQGGLTRSWNWGLYLAKDMAEYLIAGNSDVLFTPDWYVGPLEAIAKGTLDFVGPLSNAPGDAKKQQVWRYFEGYEITDDWEYLCQTALLLRQQQGGCTVRTSINGFFQLAHRDFWWAHAHSKTEVYNPKNKMVHNEYELQKRLLKADCKLGICLDSFIFHYRGVSRGRQALRGSAGRGHFRPQPKERVGERDT